MSISSIGIDMVRIDRMKKACTRSGEMFLRRVFTPEEKTDIYDYKHLAGCFAAKEAFLKALGTGLAEGITWLDLSVETTDALLPTLSLSGKAESLLGSRKVHLTITCTDTTVVAAVILLH